MFALFICCTMYYVVLLTELVQLRLNAEQYVYIRHLPLTTPVLFLPTSPQPPPQSELPFDMILAQICYKFDMILHF